MFKHNKNKKEESDNNKDARIKNDDVVFHTMRDDLKDMDGKITLNKKKSGADIKKMEMKKENKHISPFSNNAFKKPEISPAPSESLHNKPHIGQRTSSAENLKSSALPKGHKILKDKKKNTALVFLIPAIIILIIISVALGLYLFWKTGNSVEVPATTPITKPVEKQKPVEILPEKYSSENPNYLSIDTENASSENIAQLLIQTASEIKELKNNGPFEFIITDANNNPISFSIFAHLSELNLSQNVLDNFDESFSLYFYRDNGTVRLGVAANIQDTGAIISKMAREEDTLVSELRPLFLNNSFSEAGRSFNTSQYKNFKIRYINFNEENTISVDYSVTENQLIVGTSKNTIRVIIDKTEQSKNLTTEKDAGADIEL